jgi:uncharacterized sulfatase
VKTSVSRFGIAALLALAPLAGSAAPAGLPDTSKMNVLFIITEDTNPDVFGCAGNTICKTPNMDRFATTAVRFDRAYVQGIACNPSRSSFLSGLRPVTSGVWNNQQVMSERLPAGTRTMPELLKQKGFHTAVIGKFFHITQYAEKQMMAFDRIEHAQPPPGWQGEPSVGKNRPAAAKAGEKGAVLKERLSKEAQQKRRQNSDRYGDSGRQTEEEGDYQISQTAVKLLEKFAQSKQQFFLSVHQSRPHTPLIAPKKYIDMYDPAKIPLPPAPPASLKNFPYAKRAAGGNPDIFTQRQPTEQQTREAIAAYYACVTFVDENIGRILGALEKQGLADKTIVFILGDHGWHLGDHGMWSKYSLLEPVHRAPLFVRVPGAPANGRVCREFVEFVDFIPTLGDLVGLEVAPNLEGTSFAPLLANPDRPWKRAVFMVNTPDEQGVRNRRYRYMEFKGGPVPVALYDLEKDPWETVNLADDPALAKTRAEMAALLRAGWKAALPKDLR